MDADARQQQRRDDIESGEVWPEEQTPRLAELYESLHQAERDGNTLKAVMIERAIDQWFDDNEDARLDVRSRS